MFIPSLKNVSFVVSSTCAILLTVLIIALKIEISVHKEDKEALLAKLELAVLEKKVAQLR